jgi:hypothetical protein
MRSGRKNELPLGYIAPDLAPLSTPQPLRLVMLKYSYRCLKTYDWNITKAARVLNIATKTLRNYVKEMRGAGVLIPLADDTPSGFRDGLAKKVEAQYPPKNSGLE